MSPYTGRPATSTITRERERNANARTENLGAFEGLSEEVQVGQVKELLCQALETEIGGVRIYETAIDCAANEELKEEWGKYLEETRNHERILTEVFETLGIDTETETPGREVVRANGEALVKAMETARDSGDADLAQIVAAECVVLAETKDHLNWELIGEVAENFEGEGGRALMEAHEEVEEQEDEHLYHTRGWARELWLESLGLPAVLPPPEEQRSVTSAIDAARAKNARGRMIGGKKRGGGTKARGRRNTGGGRAKARTKTPRTRARGR